MQKTILCLLCCCYAPTTFAQTNFLDSYIGNPVTVTTIASSAMQVASPTDLDFKPNSNELWVCNYGNSSGGSAVIFYDAGLPNQSHQYRKDTHNGHFMIYPTALAFSDIGEWASVNEIKNTNSSATSTFMGPALWSGDTAIYARVFQNNWVSGYPLGSHLDMLHQSPFAMGIAHDSAKAYWVMDGHFGNICKYDFVMDHGPGYDNHSAGKIWRYIDVPVTRTPTVPSHMVLDKNSGWLYYIDGQSKQVRRMNTATGNITGTLSVPSTSNEPLSGYWKVESATVEVLVTLATQPCGIDYYKDRLVVSDYTNGNIYIYNTSGAFTLLGTITTGLPGMMGVKVGPDGRIWCVNKTQSKVYRLDVTPPATDLAVIGITSPAVVTQTPGFFSDGFNVCDGTVTPGVTLLNSGTNTVSAAALQYTIDGGPPVAFGWSGSLAAGATQTVSLPASAVVEGEHLLRITINTVNGSVDEVDLNNTIDGSFRVLAPAVTLPLTEDFSATTFPPPGWSYVHFNPNNLMERLPSGGFGQSVGSLRMNNFSGPMNISGQKDHFLSPVIDMTGASANNWLRFNVAYAQRNSSTNDKLEVFVSIDCGVNWTTVYSKAGAALSTRPVFAGFYNPASSEWRTDSVSLSGVSGQSEVMVKFTTTSSFGNMLYIDDIFVGEITTGIAQSFPSGVSIFPNPVTDALVVNGLSLYSSAALIIINDMQGREVLRSKANPGEGRVTLSLRTMAGGAYSLRLVLDEGVFVTRFIKE